MAIGLNQVKKSKKPQVVTAQKIKDQSARPWETFDQLGPQARTVQANEALRKVGKKKASDNVVSFKHYKKKKEKAQLKASDIFNQVDVPCSSAGLVGFLKRLFLY